MFKSINRKLLQTQDPIQIGIFRAGFGFFLLVESIYFYRVHLIQDYLLAPKFHFHYSFLAVPILPELILQTFLAMLMISSILIMIGLFYRPSILLFLSIFAYFMLCDTSFYNNHIYLIGIILFLLLFLPGDQRFSLKKGPQSKGQVWNLWLLRIQVLIVYFFGGVSKLNEDWLFRLEPVRTILNNNGIGGDFPAYLMAYGGTLFDLFIGILLLVPRLRWLGILGVLFFNLSNNYLFDDINIFPFLMIFSSILFFESRDLESLGFKSKVIEKGSSNQNPRFLPVIALFLAFQLIFPLRHFLIPGNADWTGEGVRFSWRMKLQSRNVQKMDYWIYDLDSKTIFPVDIDIHINDYQREQMAQYPQMMLQFAHYLGKQALEVHGFPNTMVKADILISMNKRQHQLVFNPDHDLLELEWSHWHNQWIIPLEK